MRANYSETSSETVACMRRVRSPSVRKLIVLKLGEQANEDYNKFVFPSTI